MTPRCGCFSSPAAANWEPATPGRPTTSTSSFAGPSGLPPAILCFKDSDLEPAVRFVVGRAFINGGQVPCLHWPEVGLHPTPGDLRSGERDDPGADARGPGGNPRDPKTRIGPIKVERTLKLLDRALAALPDPHFLVPPRQDGQWQGPFLVETFDPPDTELFGPFLALVPVASDEAAVAQVLPSRYPFLVAWFGTPPPGRKTPSRKNSA